MFLKSESPVIPKFKIDGQISNLLRVDPQAHILVIAGLVFSRPENSDFEAFFVLFQTDAYSLNGILFEKRYCLSFRCLTVLEVK